MESVIMLIVTVFLSVSGIYLYQFIPQYQTCAESEIYKEKSSGIYLKRYILLSILVNLIVVSFYNFLYINNTVMKNISTICVLSFLWPAAYFDYKFLKIPNVIIQYAVILRFIELIPQFIIYRKNIVGFLFDELIVIVLVVIICMTGNLVIKNSIGMGDIKLMIVMGLFLGTSSLFSCLFFTLLISFILAVILLLAGKKNKKDVIPFAPSILAGTIIAAILMGI